MISIALTPCNLQLATSKPLDCLSDLHIFTGRSTFTANHLFGDQPSSCIPAWIQHTEERVSLASLHNQSRVQIVYIDCALILWSHLGHQPWILRRKPTYRGCCIIVWLPLDIVETWSAFVKPVGNRVISGRDIASCFRQCRRGLTSWCDLLSQDWALTRSKAKQI